MAVDLLVDIADIISEPVAGSVSIRPAGGVTLYRTDGQIIAAVKATETLGTGGTPTTVLFPGVPTSNDTDLREDSKGYALEVTVHLKRAGRDAGPVERTTWKMTVGVEGSGLVNLANLAPQETFPMSGYASLEDLAAALISGGATMVPGPPGPTGPTGPTGPKGDKGDPGEDGMKAGDVVTYSSATNYTLRLEQGGISGGLRIAHTGSRTNPDSGYPLQVTNTDAGDTVNMVGLNQGGSYTVLNIEGSNAQRSTLKVVNSWAQTGGAVIAGVATNANRTMPVFAADNPGKGHSFSAQHTEGSTGVGLYVSYPSTNVASQSYGAGVYVGGQHVKGQVAQFDNAAAQTAGAGVVLINQANAGSTTPALSLVNAGTGPTIAAPGWQLLPGGVAASARQTQPSYIPNGYFAFWFDETAGEIKVRARKSDGTYLSGVVATLS